MSVSRPSLDEAKTRLDVAALWRLLNLPGEPTRSCRCPLHDDRSASFSVYTGIKGTLRWKCHAGCGEGGPVELLARVFDIGGREACRRFVELANTAAGIPVDLPTRPLAAPILPSARRMLLPVGLNLGARSDLITVAERRGLSLMGVELAAKRGLIWFAEPRGYPAWIVKDVECANAQARRLDGGTWPHIGGAKAWTLPGSRAAWPIGAREASALPFVVVVEGGPDLLAAHHFIMAEGRENEVAAVAMLGASNHIPDDALALLAGHRVRLFPHADPAGMAAAVRWTGQLRRVGCEVDAYSFDGLRRADGGAVKDLNDLANVDADCFESGCNGLGGIMPE